MSESDELHRLRAAVKAEVARLRETAQYRGCSDAAIEAQLLKLELASVEALTIAIADRGFRVELHA